MAATKPKNWRVKKTEGRFTPRYTFHDERGAMFVVTFFGDRMKEGDAVVEKIRAALAKAGA